jgi:methyltransferase (TIGR00027 family)
MMVALWRAYADFGLTSVPNFKDAAASKLLDGPIWRVALRWGEALAHKPEESQAGMRWYLDVVVLRVAFIDALIAETRARQVVILGAGLDTRAWRCEALRGVRVFEVDHPSTQSYKRAHASRLGATLAELSFVPVDFSITGALERALAEAGHDPTQPTLWVWEGVIMYLDDAALRGTLGVIRRGSAPGSRLLAHYHEPAIEPVALRWRRFVLKWVGEPQIGLRSSAVIADELTRAGFELEQDADLTTQALRVGAPARTDPRGLTSRIAVARPA